MNTSSKLPDFLIIGAMKCGTTSLHDYLGKHPEIYTTTPKELHYFSDPNFQDRSFEWYKNHFFSTKNISGASPQNYTKRHLTSCEQVAKRLHTHIPNVKLIYLVRDPIARIISHYNEAQEGGYAPKVGLNDFLADYSNNHYVHTSMYYYQISAFLEFFPLSQILIVDGDELRYNRLPTLNKIFKFLGVNALDNDKLFDYETNTSSFKRRQTRIGKWIFSSHSSHVRALLPQGVKNYFRNSGVVKNLAYSDLITDEISPSLRDELKSFLQPDVDALRALTGERFVGWTL